jgi:putative endonuclease
MIYVGMADDLEKRIREHKNGKTRSTKNKGSFFVKIIEKCNSRIEARKREKYWKSGCGKEKLKNLAG